MTIDPRFFVLALAVQGLLVVLAFGVGAFVYWRGTGRANPLGAIRKQAQTDPVGAARNAVAMRQQYHQEAEKLIRTLTAANPPEAEGFRRRE